MEFCVCGNEDVRFALEVNLAAAGFEKTTLEKAQAIFTFCETQTELEDIYFDSEGIIQKAQKQAYLIDLSASTPGFARELNAVAAVNDLHAIEAPLCVEDVTLANAFSDKENLSCFIAGAEADVDAVRPLLDEVAETLIYTGNSGSAQMAKTAITLQKSASLVAVMEADALYRVSGMSSEAAISAAYGQGLIDEATMKMYHAATAERFAGTFTVAMLMAELTAALMAADDLDLILPGAEAALHLLELLTVIGGGTMTPPALSLAYGEESACARHGLDWTKAEQAYAEAEAEFESDYEYERSHNHDEFPGGFGGYSSN